MGHGITHHPVFTVLHDPTGLYPTGAEFVTMAFKHTLMAGYWPHDMLVHFKGNLYFVSGNESANEDTPEDCFKPQVAYYCPTNGSKPLPNIKGTLKGYF